MILSIYKIVKREVSWIFFQIIVSFLPLGIGVAFTLFLGYKIDIVDIFPDYLLAAFAIGMNLIGFDKEKREKLPEYINDGFVLFSKAITIIAVIFYIGLFNKGYISIAIMKRLKERGKYIKGFMLIIIILIVIDTIIAVWANCIPKDKDTETGMNSKTVNCKE